MIPLLIAAGASLVGGAMASKSAKKAADAQADSAREATQVQKQISDDQIGLQREQFNRVLEQQEPFRQTGLAAQNRLNFLLGLSPVNRDASDPAVQQIRNRLMPQFTETTNKAGLSGPELDAAVAAEVAKRGGATQFEADSIREALSHDSFSSVTRENALQDAVLGELNGGTGGAGGGGQDGEFGSLMRDFSMDDFQADPGYQFRMDQGTRALDSSASARGGLYSGRAAKDLQRFGQGLGAQEYQSAFNRFQTNRSNKLNPLQSLMGAGQTATNLVGVAGQNYATGAGNAMGNYGSQAGENIMGAGNARASGYIGSGNAITGAVGQGVSAYQNNRLLDMINKPAAYDYSGNGGGGGNYNWGGGN
jgi:hypothetical protein